MWQVNVMWDPGWDIDIEKGHWAETKDIWIALVKT